MTNSETTMLTAMVETASARLGIGVGGMVIQSDRIGLHTLPDRVSIAEGARLLAAIGADQPAIYHYPDSEDPFSTIEGVTRWGTVNIYCRFEGDQQVPIITEAESGDGPYSRIVERITAAATSTGIAVRTINVSGIGNGARATTAVSIHPVDKSTTAVAGARLAEAIGVAETTVRPTSRRAAVDGTTTDGALSITIFCRPEPEAHDA